VDQEDLVLELRDAVLLLRRVELELEASENLIND